MALYELDRSFRRYPPERERRLIRGAADAVFGASTFGYGPSIAEGVSNVVSGDKRRAAVAANQAQQAYAGRPGAGATQDAYITRRATDRADVGDLGRMQELDRSALFDQSLSPEQKRAIQLGMRERSATIAGLSVASGPKGVPLSPDEKRAMIERGVAQTALLAEQDRRSAATPAAGPDRDAIARDVQSARQARGLGLGDRPGEFSELQRLRGAGTASRLQDRVGQIEEAQFTQAQQAREAESAIQGPEMSDEAIAQRIRALSEAEAVAQRNRRQSQAFMESDALERATDTAAADIRTGRSRERAVGELAQRDRVQTARRERAVEEARGTTPTTEQDRIARAAEIDTARTTAQMSSIENAVIRSGYRSLEDFNTDVDELASNLEGSVSWSDFAGFGYDDEAISARGRRIVDSIRSIPDPMARRGLAQQVFTRLNRQGEVGTTDEANVREILDALAALFGQ